MLKRVDDIDLRPGVRERAHYARHVAPTMAPVVRLQESDARSSHDSVSLGILPKPALINTTRTFVRRSNPRSLLKFEMILRAANREIRIGEEARTREGCEGPPEFARLVLFFFPLNRVP